MQNSGTDTELVEELDRFYLKRKIDMYLKAKTEELKNDLLFRIGTNAEVLTFDDVFIINDKGGILNQEQRQQIIDFVKQEFKDELKN